MEGDFAPTIHLQTTGKSFWNSSECSGEAAGNAPCYLTLLNGNVFVLCIPFNSHISRLALLFLLVELQNIPYFIRGIRSPHKLPPAHQRGKNLTRALASNAPGNPCCPEFAGGWIYSIFCAQQWPMPLLSFPTAMHPFKRRGKFSFCKDQARTQSDSGGWLGQSSRPPEWFCWCISEPSPIPLIPSSLQAPLSTSTATWQLTGDELGGPDPAHGLPRHSLDQGHSSFCCTDNTQQAVTQHSHCSSGTKTTSEWPQKEKKICMGTHGPTCALSGLQYCQERRGTWPKSLSTATKVLKAQL